MISTRGFGAFLLAGAVACGRGDGDRGADAFRDTLAGDTVAGEESEDFWVDPAPFAEMKDGRLDTVDMVGRSDDAAWHVQQMNYTDQFIAMTYATWYIGPDSLVHFAADRQPYLRDDRGNVYEGNLVPDNPRIKIETGTTGVGVYVFDGPVAPEADSLTLYVNDSTPPVIQVGPFAVEHEAGGLQMGASPPEEPRDTTP